MKHEKVEAYVIHFDGVPNFNQWCAVIEEAGGVYVIGKSIGRQCVIVYAGTPAVHDRVSLFVALAASDRPPFVTDPRHIQRNAAY